MALNADLQRVYLFVTCISTVAVLENCKKLVVKGGVFHNIRRKSPFGGRATCLLLV